MTRFACTRCGRVVSHGYHSEFDAMCVCDDPAEHIPTAEKLRRCLADRTARISLSKQPFVGQDNVGRFDISEVAAFAAVLQSPTSWSRACVVRLDLRDIAIGPLVAALLPDAPLAVDQLDVSCSSQSAAALATLLPRLPRLSLLAVTISSNGAAAAAVSLMPAFAAVVRGGVLQSLRLSGPAFALAGLDLVLQAAAPSCALKRLDLLSFAVSAKVVDAIALLPHLEHLAFSCVASNEPMWKEESAIASVCQLVERVTSLKTLDLRGNDASLAQFWPAMARAPHVLHLIVGVPDHEGALLHLAGTLTTLRSLVLCDMRGNVIQEQLGLVPSIGASFSTRVRLVLPLRVLTPFGPGALKSIIDFRGQTPDNLPLPEAAAKQWAFACDLPAITANTTLSFLSLNSRAITDNLNEQFAWLRVVPLLRSIGHRNRKIEIDIDDLSRHRDVATMGVSGWTKEVRPVLAQVALGLCSADLPTLVIVEVLSELDLPILRLRNFDVLIWEAVALVRSAFVKKLTCA